MSFSHGDLVTGVDRTYPRLIYRFLGVDKIPARYVNGGRAAAVLEPVSYQGRGDLPLSEFNQYVPLEKVYTLFRKASQEEIAAEGLLGSKEVRRALPHSL